MCPNGEIRQADGTTITTSTKFVDAFNQVKVLNYVPSIRIYLITQEDNSDFNMATMSVDKEVLSKHVEVHGKKPMKKLLSQLKKTLDSL